MNDQTRRKKNRLLPVCCKRMSSVANELRLLQKMANLKCFHVTFLRNYFNLFKYVLSFLLVLIFLLEFFEFFSNLF